MDYFDITSTGFDPSVQQTDRPCQSADAHNPQIAQHSELHLAVC